MSADLGTGERGHTQELPATTCDGRLTTRQRAIYREAVRKAAEVLAAMELDRLAAEAEGARAPERAGEPAA